MLGIYFVTTVGAYQVEVGCIGPGEAAAAAVAVGEEVDCNSAEVVGSGQGVSCGKGKDMGSRHTF